MWVQLTSFSFALQRVVAFIGFLGLGIAFLFFVRPFPPLPSSPFPSLLPSPFSSSNSLLHSHSPPFFHSSLSRLAPLWSCLSFRSFLTDLVLLILVDLQHFQPQPICQALYFRKHLHSRQVFLLLVFILLLLLLLFLLRFLFTPSCLSQHVLPRWSYETGEEYVRTSADLVDPPLLLRHGRHFVRLF